MSRQPQPCVPLRPHPLIAVCLLPPVWLAEAQNDRLVAAAVKFAEDIAKQHDEQAGVTHAPPNEWTLVAGQLPEYTFHS